MIKNKQKSPLIFYMHLLKDAWDIVQFFSVVHYSLSNIVNDIFFQVKENVEVSIKCESKGGKPAAKVNTKKSVFCSKLIYLCK